MHNNQDIMTLANATSWMTRLNQLIADGKWSTQQVLVELEAAIRQQQLTEEACIYLAEQSQLISITAHRLTLAKAMLRGHGYMMCRYNGIGESYSAPSLARASDIAHRRLPCALSDLGYIEERPARGIVLLYSMRAADNIYWRDNLQIWSDDVATGECE